MFLNGYDNHTSQIVEIVDLGSGATKCDYLPRYPLATRGTFGGLVNNSTPLVCGGLDTNECFLFEDGRWQNTFAMVDVRFHFAGMPSSPYSNPSHWFFVLGPDNAEVLTDTGWQNIGPLLPASIFVPCLVVINETAVLVIAGTINSREGETYSKSTFIFNAVTSLWSPGPSLSVGRRSMGCGRIPDSGNSGRHYFIVAGGENALRSVELLPTMNDQWTAGNIYVVPTYVVPM
jgi:hypothetical protein